MKPALRILLSSLLAAAMLVALSWWGGVTFDDVADAWAELPLSSYLLALAIHFAVYNVRSVRYRLLIPVSLRPDHGSVLAVSAAHNLATYVLPARTGDVSLVVYLRGQCGVPVEIGLAALVVSRILDLAMLFIVLGTASAWLGTTGVGDLPLWLGPGGYVILGLGLMLVPLAAFADRLTGGMERLGRRLRLDRIRMGERLLDKIGLAGASLRDLGSSGRLWVVALLTCFVWIGLFAMYSVLAYGLGLPETISIPKAIFGAGMAVLTNLLPINALAGFGTQEAGWAFGFSEVLGLPRDKAIATGLAVHLVQILNVCLLGLLGHIAMGLLAPRPLDGGR